ncbi:MAG TPA: glycosyltransferase [Mesotoga infera]|uniref:Glycosyltransferase n=1 Tax=Mesotoga infera TaxID=1236046 RepID=A0A7C1CU99_9BACT|nr:glycosyltransferase [Mesotoga infera]
MSSLLFQSISVALFLGMMSVISVSNAILMRKISRFEGILYGPLVSVLIPARNEEKNISKCVYSLLNQDYRNLELIVLDDNSSDATLQILESIRSESNKLRIIKGEALPEGWLGKHWACHQLAREAKGEILLFTDADTVHASSTVSQATGVMIKERTDLLTAIVKERTDTLGELITIPFMIHSVFSIFPLVIAYGKRFKSLAVTSGQFMMFRRLSYLSIGGHEAVKDHGVDDISLGRLIKKAGMKWRLYDASDLVECKMYGGFKAAYLGFLKNYFSLFDYRILPAAFVWGWMLTLDFFPLIVALLFIFGAAIPESAGILSLISLTLSFGMWLLASVKFSLRPLAIFLYPLITLISSIIGFHSIIVHLCGATKWKGRVLVKKKSRLF